MYMYIHTHGFRYMYACICMSLYPHPPNRPGPPLSPPLLCPTCTHQCYSTQQHWTQAHIWIVHVPRVDESWSTYRQRCHSAQQDSKLKAGLTWRSHVPHMHESYLTYEWVMSHIWIRHTPYTHRCHSPQQAAELKAGLTSMSHVPHDNESCHTHTGAIHRSRQQSWSCQITGSRLFLQRTWTWNCRPTNRHGSTYTYMHMYLHVSIFLNIHIYVYTHGCIYITAHMDLEVKTNIHVEYGCYWCDLKKTDKYTYIYIQAHTHTHTQTHKHTHKYK